MTYTLDTHAAADWTATETRTTDDRRRKWKDDTIVRVLNDLNVEVTWTLSVTHLQDETYQYDEQTFSEVVPAGGVGGTLITEPWERVRISITPTTTPTAGDLTLIELGGV